MKVNSKILMLFLGVMACDASANQDGYYLGLGLGKTKGYVPLSGELPSGNYGGAAVYSFAIGKQFNENIAFDIDLSYRGDFLNNDRKVYTINGVQDGDISLTSLSMMLNGYYYFYNQSEFFKPYIFGGAGASRNKTSNMILTGDDEGALRTQVTYGQSTVSFAWKLGVGIKYVLDSNFDVDLRYQFVNLGNVNISNSGLEYGEGAAPTSHVMVSNPSKLQAHELLIGIKYKF